MALVLKGAQGSNRVAKKSSTSASAQLFQPVLLSFSGAGELKTAIGIEANGASIALNDKFLYCGFYVNELLCRMWPQNIASEDIYLRYHQLLMAFSEVQKSAQQKKQHNDIQQTQMVLEQLLRQFEFELLYMLGFAINWHYCAHSQLPIVAQCNYTFDSEQGFSVSDLTADLHGQCKVFCGADILAIASGEPLQGQTLLAAKCLSRLALAPHLGDKPLKSRELFKLI